MSSSYPAPAYALQVWLCGPEIAVAIPGVNGAPGHTVTIPANERGMEALMRVLRSRVDHKGPATIGTRAAPVQYDLDKITKYMADGKQELTLDDL